MNAPQQFSPAPAPSARALPWRLRRVLTPTDFSPPSEYALAYAREFVRRMAAEWIVLHVSEGMVCPLRQDTPQDVRQRQAHVLRKLEGHLTLLANRICASADLPLPGSPPRLLVTPGTPAAEIVRVAREEDVDLIIIATHGYTGIGRVTVGSTTGQVLQQSPCPVLTVRRREWSGIPETHSRELLSSAPLPSTVSRSVRRSPAG